ncbi:hypothetical protein M422DRAFT_261901 [Sphaerobolus stellatus SS14]|uniref:Unplaced genomic scaffold SPHSTscaffold_110, whole genome shotgun sequence n=1 Tax=Sphaerobolus stellatus (strain SS14) TaxID=990650 RepID=A0A0C9ULF9_SPHS4|nr:hypothetical protein M422DRAFT_261901 [Sphaerobolus stellatus SS14]
MPCTTEQQLVTKSLFKLFFLQLLAEGEQAMIEDPDYEDEYMDTPFSTTILETICKLQEKRYLQQCIAIRKSEALLHLVLGEYKAVRPELFRIYHRVMPATFDTIIANLRDNPVFHNNSENEQLPVEIQVAVALHHFGHFGNAASIQKVEIWAGLGFGTVDLVTRRVMAARPDAAIKEKAMMWVEAHSCPAWHKGWCMVDRTLVPLPSWPAHFGNTWYDRKRNYSLNVQLISTPDLQIIDYGVGLPGSQHDTTAWKEPRIPKERATLLGAGEWVWTDSVYPLQSWCQAPYKRPEKDIRENATYNFTLSGVHV